MISSTLKLVMMTFYSFQNVYPTLVCNLQSIIRNPIKSHHSEESDILTRYFSKKCHIMENTHCLVLIIETESFEIRSSLYNQVKVYTHPFFCSALWPCTEVSIIQVLYYYNTTRVGTLIVATIYLQLIQNRYMFRSFTVL